MKYTRLQNCSLNQFAIFDVSVKCNIKMTLYTGWRNRPYTVSGGIAPFIQSLCTTWICVLIVTLLSFYRRYLLSGRLSGARNRVGRFGEEMSSSFAGIRTPFRSRCSLVTLLTNTDPYWSSRFLLQSPNECFMYTVLTTVSTPGERGHLPHLHYHNITGGGAKCNSSPVGGPV